MNTPRTDNAHSYAQAGGQAHSQERDLCTGGRAPYDYDHHSQRGNGLNVNSNVRTLLLRAPFQPVARERAHARGAAPAGDLAADTGERVDHRRASR